MLHNNHQQQYKKNTSIDNSNNTPTTTTTSTTMTSTVNPLHIVPPSHHSTPQHSRYPSSMTGTATSSSISTPMHTSSKQLNDWYLKVAVGGRRNFLFQEDNLTPAPYHHEPVPQPPQFDDISNAGDNQVIQIEGMWIIQIGYIQFSYIKQA